MKIFLRLFSSNLLMPKLGRWYVPKVATISVDQVTKAHCVIKKDEELDEYMTPFVILELQGLK